MDKEKFFLEILFFIVMAVLFIMILSRVFGHSATDIQLYIGFFSGLLMVLSYVVKLNREVGEIKTEMKYNFAGIKNGFVKMKQDMGEIKSLIKRGK